jgi:hypothetical protein
VAFGWFEIVEESFSGKVVVGKLRCLCEELQNARMDAIAFVKDLSEKKPETKESSGWATFVLQNPL